MYELIEKFKSKDYQIAHSSLAKISKEKVTYEECRKYACEDISRKLAQDLTRFISDSSGFIIEIPFGTDFHFIGRVDTSFGGNNPESYYRAVQSRNFVAFSTISNKNVSRYRGSVFFIYDIQPEDIAHIFPMDSDTKRDATCEEDLTYLPSLWLTLEDLDSLTYQLEVYNQITCKTKRNGQILKPLAVGGFDNIDARTEEIAKSFGIKYVIMHPDEDAINYNRDLLYDSSMLNSIHDKMYEEYEIPVKSMLYLD